MVTTQSIYRHTLISITGALILWECVARSGVVPSTLFPAPTEVLFAITQLWHSGELLSDLWSSLWRVLLGLFIGGSVGIAVGLLTGRITMIDRIISPIFNMLRALPPVAIIPLIIVWFGIGEIAKIFSISFAVIFPVWVNTHVGAAGIPMQYLRAAATLPISPFRRWGKVILPASLPFVIAGIRNAIAVAFIMVFVSELAGASAGLGYLISISHLAYRIDQMMAGLVILGLCAALTDFFFSRAVRRIFPWLGM